MKSHTHGAKLEEEGTSSDRQLNFNIVSSLLFEKIIFMV